MNLVDVAFAFGATLVLVGILPLILNWLVDPPVVARFEINETASPSVVLETRQEGFSGWLEARFGRNGRTVQTLKVSPLGALFEGAVSGTGMLTPFRYRVDLPLTEISGAECVPCRRGIVIGVETRKGYVRGIRFKATGSERALLLERAERAVKGINDMLPFPRKAQRR